MIIEPLPDISFIITDFISVDYILILRDGLQCYSVGFVIFCTLGCFDILKNLSGWEVRMPLLGLTHSWGSKGPAGDRP